MDIEIDIRTRTPIWTACARPSTFYPYGHWPMWVGYPIAATAGGPFDRIRPDVLLTSMRWWFDAAMRALDQRVCDAPDGVRCGTCIACHTFAQVAADVTVDATEPIPAGIMMAKREWGCSWNTPPARVGAFRLRLSGDDVAVARLAALLALLERIGGIGMRLPEGYGAYAIEKCNGSPLDAVIAMASWPQPAAHRRVAADVLPDLRDIIITQCVICPHVPGWWTSCDPIIPVALRIQPLVQRGMTPITSAVHAALERRTKLRRPQMRAVFGAQLPNALPARVAVTWAFQDNPPDDPAAPWREPWRTHAVVWTGGLPATARKRVESAIVDPELWATAIGDTADVEVRVARLKDADCVIEALRGGAVHGMADDAGSAAKRCSADASAGGGACDAAQQFQRSARRCR
jgi:hypothetical protein